MDMVMIMQSAACGLPYPPDQEKMGVLLEVDAVDG